MLVTLLGMVTLVRLVQPPNASFPMLVTLFPIATLVRPVQFRTPVPDAGEAVGNCDAGHRPSSLNALPPMLVTGSSSYVPVNSFRTFIVLGMVTAPPAPGRRNSRM